MRTRIQIDDLRVDCVVGCHAAERERVQELAVSLDLELDGREAAYEDRLDYTVDYQSIERGTRFILQAGRFRLLETAGHLLVRYVLAPPPAGGPAPLSANVSLSKFGVLSGDARARVQMSSQAHAESYTREVREWGSIEVLMENRWLGLYRFNVAPGCRVPPILLSRLRGRSLAETAGLVGWDANGPTDVLEPGGSASWDPEMPETWRNLGEEPASLLCLTRPVLDDIRTLELPKVVD